MELLVQTHPKKTPKSKNAFEFWINQSISMIVLRCIVDSSHSCPMDLQSFEGDWVPLAFWLSHPFHKSISIAPLWKKEENFRIISTSQNTLLYRNDASILSLQQGFRRDCWNSKARLPASPKKNAIAWMLRDDNGWWGGTLSSCAIEIRSAQRISFSK